MEAEKNANFVQLDRAYGFYRRAVNTNVKVGPAEAKLKQAIANFKAAFPGFDASMNDLSLIVGADLLGKFLFRNRRGCLTLLFEGASSLEVPPASESAGESASETVGEPASETATNYSSPLGSCWGDIPVVDTVERAIKITQSIPKETRKSDQARLWKDTKKNTKPVDVKNRTNGPNISSIMKRVYSKPKSAAESTAALTEAPTAAPVEAPTAVPTTKPVEAPTAVPTDADAPTDAPAVQSEPVHEKLNFII